MIAAAHAIDAAWCDLAGVYLRGWAHCHARPVLAGALCSSGREVALAFTKRPDVQEAYPDVPAGQDCGFAAYLECPAFRPITIRLQTDDGPAEIDVTVGPEAGPRGATPDRAAPLDRFIAEMKALRGTVIEIGARVVGAYSALRADQFAPECRFIGTDIHAAPGVDLVVDAHRLSRSVTPGSIDGVFSLAVMEHLAAPWVVAAEINRVLRLGGLTLHLLPQTFPVHEQPNDFWRMSDDALRLLFGPATGFEVLDAAMVQAVQIVPSPKLRYGEFLNYPLIPGYAAAFILSRKVTDLKPGAVRWPMPDLALSRAYPAHAAPSRPRNGTRRNAPADAPPAKAPPRRK